MNFMMTVVINSGLVVVVTCYIFLDMVHLILLSFFRIQDMDHNCARM